LKKRGKVFGYKRKMKPEEDTVFPCLEVVHYY